MNDQDAADLVKAPPIVAMIKEIDRSDSRKAFDQVVDREVQDAIERKQLELVALLAEAGVPVNEFDDTPDGIRQLHEYLNEHDISIDRLIFQDNWAESGTHIYRAGILIGIVNAEIVRGVMV